MTSLETHVFRCGLTRKREDLADLEFEQHWHNIHAPLVLDIPGVLVYAQNTIRRQLILDHSVIDRDLNGISMLGFASHNDMKKGGNSMEHHACIADVANFLSEASLLVMASPAIDRAQFHNKPKVIALFAEGSNPQAFVRYVSEQGNETKPWVNTLHSQEMDHLVDDRTVTEKRMPVSFMTELYFNSGSELARFWKTASEGMSQNTPVALFETCETLQK